MYKVNLFLRSGSLPIFNIFSGSALPLVPLLPMEQTLPLQDSMLEYSEYSTVFQSLTTKTIRGSNRQNQYCGVFGKLLQQPTNQTTSTDRLFVDCWEHHELCIPNNDLLFNQRKSDFISLDRDTTITIQSPCWNTLPRRQAWLVRSIQWTTSSQCPRQLRSKNQP